MIKTPQYQIGLSPAPDGQLRWALKARELPCDDLQVSGEKKNSGPRRTIFYDDGRNRRLFYEVDFERDSFRYVLEKDDQRTVFPTLQAAVFCLAGCISRNE